MGEVVDGRILSPLFPTGDSLLLASRATLMPLPTYTPTPAPHPFSLSLLHALKLVFLLCTKGGRVHQGDVLGVDLGVALQARFL